MKYELEFFIEDFIDSKNTKHYRYYDIFIPQYNLLVEIDGSIHRKFGKYDIEADDQYKDYLALSNGFIIERLVDDSEKDESTDLNVFLYMFKNYHP